MSAADNLSQLMEDLVSTKERDPGDDLLGRVVERNRLSSVFTHELLVGLAELLLIGGYETTSNMITLGTLHILRSPGARNELGKSSESVRAVVEEILRCYPVIETLPRFAKEDIVVADVTIRAGDAVVLSLGSANRDPSAFIDPDSFDIERGGRHHLAFGYGIHQCVGQNLARIELEIVFETLLRRIPGIRLAVDAEDLQFNPLAPLNGVPHLPVIW